MPRILLSFMATATAVLVSGISPVNAQTHPSNSGPKEGASLRQEPPETKIFDEFDNFDNIVQKLRPSCSGTTPEGQTTLSFTQDNTPSGIVQTIKKTTQLDFKNVQTEGIVIGQWTVERTISPSRFQTIAYEISFSGKANSSLGGDPQAVLGGELAKAREKIPEGLEKILGILSGNVSALCK